MYVQVHPYLFTTGILSLAVEHGVHSVRGRVTSIDRADGRVTGVQYVDPDTGSPDSIAADYVIVASGAWSATLLPDLPITGQRAHSIGKSPVRSIL